MADKFDERVIVRSAATRLDDVVALAIYFDHGQPIAGALDLPTIRAIRRQLDVCENWLASGTEPAE